MDYKYELADRLATAEQKLAEYEQLFDVQWKRMQDATELWRAEAPQERELVQPDLGALLAWLIEKAGLKEPKAAPALSLGEQPHDPANCFYHHGSPHLGPCMDAEAYTRWYWLDGPGSRPVSSTAIALATSKLVAEAYAAREQRRAAGPLSGIEPTEAECPFDFSHTRHWCGYAGCCDA